MRTPENIRGLATGKKEVWGETTYESERQALVAEYGAIEDVYNRYVAGNERAPVLADRLGNAALGVGGKNSAAQVYAYELLMKSLAETKRPEDRRAIVQELIFDAAVTDHPVKREYLLGILGYYGSHERDRTRDEALRNEPKNARIVEEREIFQALTQESARLAEGKEMDPAMRGVADLVIRDFPRDNPEGEIARLVATYYANEPHATRIPGPRRRIINKIARHSAGRGGDYGHPRCIVVLPEGRHTSQAKIEEAKYFGIELFTHIGEVKETVKGLAIDGIVLEVTPAESLEYIEHMRAAMERGDEQAVAGIRKEYRDRVWSRLDESLQRDFGGNPDQLTVLPETIRDHSLDDAELADESADAPASESAEASTDESTA